MNCQSIQTWLLQAESLRPKAWPAAIGKHVDGCAACAKLVRDLRELEDQWREQSLPSGAEAKSRFLQKQAKLDVPTSIPMRMRPYLKPATPWLAAAAMSLFAITLFAWLSRPGPGPGPDIKVAATQTPDVVDRLLEWNLEMTNAKPGDRKKLLADTEDELRKEVKKAEPKLTPEDRLFAEKLIETGVSLAELDNPLEESERVKNVAETLAERVEKSDAKESTHRQLHFYKFMQRCVHPLEERISKMKPPEVKKGGKKVGFPFKMNPKQFQERQNDLRKSLDALRKKSWGKGFNSPHFGKRR
ncbi:MAG: hypothetical protein HYX68_09730 [Planctomycetes bacterium]|jgi:hypothetical protein|nr:hypothetical protein [Planctomycetota bacterium]